MMGPKQDDREPREEPTREALVDLGVKPQPGASSAGPNLRRKRLSDREPEGDAAPPQEEPARRPLVNLTAKPPQPGGPPIGLNLRRKRSSEGEPEGDTATPQEESARRPLVNLTAKPPEPGDPPIGLNLRRRRSSEGEPEGEDAPPRPQTDRQGRRSLAPSQPGAAERSSKPESSPEPRRPRLVSIMAAPEAMPSEGAAPEEPDEQEPRPKVGRARVTITQSVEDPAELQSIIDPPRSLTAVLAPGPGEIEVTIPDRPVRQGFSAALVGGVTAALAAALVWALITMVTGYHAGWMAIGVGLLVGGALRTMGRGEDKSFGYLGAAMWILGCLLGSVLSVCAMVGSQESLSPLNVLTYICNKPAIIPGAMLGAFHFLDPLFWGVGIYAAYRLSFRRIPPAETGNGDTTTDRAR